jgi:hypothetical protein
VPPPKKKSSTGMIIGIIAGVLALVCLICAGVGIYLYHAANSKLQEIGNTFPTAFSTTGTNSSSAAGSHTVRYEIAGSGEALITWARGTGGTDSATATLPWSKDITVNDDTFGVSIIAFGRSTDAKVEYCRISIDGTEKRKADATGGKSAICTATFVG